MPRPPRLHVSGGYYHVMLRGNHREALFTSAADRWKLNDIVGEVIGRFGVHIHVFCWMSNHMHVLIQIADRPLGELMKRIAMRYSRYRHKALRTTGHLFERRYNARLVDVDAYFLTLLRYIHLNPVKARIVSDPAEYRWSSHRAYLGLERIPWLTTDFGLSLFSSNPDQARKAYARFISSCTSVGNDDPNEHVHPNDPRILGNDGFVSKFGVEPSLPRSGVTLEELATSVCAHYGVDIAVVRSRCSRHYLTPIRLDVLRQAVEQRIATLTEVARFLGRDPSTLCKLLGQRRR